MLSIGGFKERRIMQRAKLTGAAKKFFRDAGSRGGKSRSRKYTPKQLSAWAKRGGRPSVNNKAILELLGSEPVSARFIAMKTGISAPSVRTALWVLERRGLVKKIRSAEICQHCGMPYLTVWSKVS